MEKFDVAVIGGGPGGYVCAIRAAQLGNKTVIVEKDKLGGTCLNRGCIPTKALLHSAEVFEEMLHATELGISAENIAFDYKKIADRKEKVVSRLRNGVQGLLRVHKVTIKNGKATLTGKTTFKVGDEEIEASKIILATGSFPANVPIKGADKPGVMNSDGVLALDKCPESVVIIGGGVIGIEFATLFNTLGKKVTVVEMLPNIMNGMDLDICNSMKAILQKRGIDIYTNAKVVEIKDGLEVVFEYEGKQLSAMGEICVMAVGRRPDTKDIGLEELGINMNRGFVQVDEYLRTNIPNIYAIGDITGKIQLAHVASAQGLVAAHNATGENKVMHYNIVPACIYTNPEIASVGLTEAQARDKGLDIKIGTFNVNGNGRSMVMQVSDGFAKIITDAKTGEILGGHIMGPRATDMIAEIAVAMKAEATIEELADTIHPHPTVSEIIMEAAHDVEGLCCHKA